MKETVLQRVWNEPATGEERWQVVVPRTLREAVLKIKKQIMAPLREGSSEPSKPCAVCARGSTWGRQKEMWRTFVVAVISAQPIKAPKKMHFSNSWQWELLWRE